MLLVIVPMIVFPGRFGTDLARASWVSLTLEFVFYGVVTLAFHRRSSLLKLAQAAGICLVYRLAVGALLGVVIAAMYSMQLKLSLQLGMFSYLPGLLFHVVATPFVLKQIVDLTYPIENMVTVVTQPETTPEVESAALPEPSRKAPEAPRRMPEPQRRTPEPTPAVETSGFTSIAISKKKGVSHEVTPPAENRPTATRADEDMSTVPDASASKGNGFDQATRYIGEDGSVQLAAVVDHEGLLLGHFKRGEIDPADWAPWALNFRQVNSGLLGRINLSNPEKINIFLNDRKVTLAFDEYFALMVVAERQMDDFLNIRINQSLEMIRKYISNRYSPALFENVEIDHVRSA